MKGASPVQLVPARLCGLTHVCVCGDNKCPIKRYTRGSLPGGFNATKKQWTAVFSTTAVVSVRKDDHYCEKMILHREEKDHPWPLKRIRSAKISCHILQEDVKKMLLALNW